MSAKGLAATAAQSVGTRIVEKGANKAIESLPVQKQNKIKGILMVASAVMLIVSAVRLLRKGREM